MSRCALAARLPAALAAAWMVLSALQPAAAQDPGDEDDPSIDLLPGLVAEYTGPGGTRAVRVDALMRHPWNGQPPDPRLRGRDFSVTWRGRLLTMKPGPYRLHVYADGQVTSRLAGEPILSGASRAPGWLDSKPIDLQYGYHALEISFSTTGPNPWFGLYWSGPGFQLEPLAEQYLFHDPDAHPDGLFEEGRLLAHRLACGACHAMPGPPPLAGPDLTHLAGNIHRPWLVDWLRGHQVETSTPADVSADGVARPARLMPRFDLSDADTDALADYLLAVSKQPGGLPPRPRADAGAGERLFHAVGCLACHSLGGVGMAGLMGAGDLTAIAVKRPADFFARWLHDPASVNPAHRMPIFRLSETEQADLAAYLSTLKPREPAADGATKAAPRGATNGRPADADDVRPGGLLVQQYRCASCHTLPGGPSGGPFPSAGILTGSPMKEAGCMSGPEGTRPGYCLSQAARRALDAYFRGILAAPTQPAAQAQPDGEPLDGRLLLAEHNCLGCHARGLAPGIAVNLGKVIAAHGQLTPLLPAMSPPSLNGVGDKYEASALADAVAVRNEPLRPWLAVRMPRYRLSAEQMRSLVDYLVDIDRIPDRPGKEQDGPSAGAMALAGARLVTSEGFGCTSCHPIGQTVPTGVALAARGTDLTELGRRVRKPWFDRWVRDPARMVPRMEMPSIVQPVRGVLDDRLDYQLDAVWHVLNQPGFNPPPPDPIRVVRARNVAGLDEPAIVLTDVLEMDQQVFVKPLVIGLPNRHNVLFDLYGNALAGWWAGDTARQRTRGKSWHWESGGANLLPAGSPACSELLLVLGGQRVQPERQSQSSAELDWYEWDPRGVRFGYRVTFPAGENQQPIVLRAVQELAPINRPGAQTAASGISRRIHFDGLSAAASAVVRLVAVGSGESIDAASVSLAGRPGRPVIRVKEPAGAALEVLDGAACLVLEPRRGTSQATCELEYLVDVALDQFPLAPPDPERSEPQRLDVVPGYDAVRLPLPPTQMPTGLAWRSDGTLLFSSLKGGVWLVRDTDGDGLPDSQSIYADGLPAPYGLAAHGDAIDVIAKHSLLRLLDRDSDGLADMSQVMADGWGYTADYHDWAVGLPRDAQGRYYVGLPCQQDERDAAAAHLRSAVVRLVPRQSAPDSPRPYAIEVLAAGLRFPMGLALNQRGDLFATDNQGNYNPFNELNHVVAGARYGFINQIEARPGFSPAFQSPAIDIPHPWTRSVNGICFLYTPAGAPSPGFGPFEGHLIGCEYDTRRLVRMTLEQVAGVYQGAVYPFSIEPDEGSQPALEGPVVCQVSPGGELYVGNLRDSGWGAGQNTGSIVRLKPGGRLPLGIAQVTATPGGLRIDFTGPVRRELAGRPDHYSVASYRRIPTADYGGPDVDRRTEAVESVAVAEDGSHATLKLGPLRAGFVYELRINSLAGSGEVFFPSEAHYTMRVVPPAGDGQSPHKPD